MTGLGTTPPALKLSNIEVHYGYAKALAGISFAVAPGEIVGLLGDNGAGKSTLLKVMSGALAPSSGKISVHGEPVRFHAPRDASAAGIEMVYQDLALVDSFDSVINLSLGREILIRGPLGWLGVLNKRRMRHDAAREVRQLGVKISAMTRPVEMLSGGQRQGVALARSAVRVSTRPGGVLLLDEPTAALGYEQKQLVARLMTRLAGDGVAVVLVTHDLPLNFELAHRTVVLNRGRKVADIPTAETKNDELVGWITGSRPPHLQ